MFENSHPLFQAIEQKNDGAIDAILNDFVKNELALKDIRSEDWVQLGTFKNPYQINLIECAVFFNNASLVQRLLNYISPEENQSLCLAIATTLDTNEIFEILLQDERVKPDACFSEALVWAITHKNNTAAKQLLEHPDMTPDAAYNRAVMMAAKYKNTEIIPFLLENERVAEQFNANDFIETALLTEAKSSIITAYAAKKSLFVHLSSENQAVINKLNKPH